MNIVGLIAANTNLLLTIASTLAMVPIGIRANNAINRHNAAVIAYRSAFDDVLLNLRENIDCPIAQIAFGLHAQHMAAIDKFRSHVWWRRSSFERDVEKYKDAYEIACEHGSVLASVMSEKNDYAREKRKIYRAAIDRLLSYA